MAKYESVRKFIARTNAKTVIFETGGHLITVHGDAVSAAIRGFIEVTKGHRHEGTGNRSLLCASHIRFDANVVTKRVQVS